MENWLLDSLYDSAIKLVAKGRGIEPDKAKALISDGPYTARRGHEAGLIDAVQPWEQFEAGVKQRFDGNVRLDYRYGQQPGTKIDLSSPMGIFNFYADLLGGKKPRSHKDAVAIVYVEGPIVLGSSESSILDPGSKAAASTPIRRALDKAAADDSIKAVVLRINSPGGSATASEIILNATKRVKAKKPLVVSMGGVAGSGGYYVACGADTVFADATTITGSIGVVGGKLATTEMWNKVGITWKEYNRGNNAALMSSSNVFTPGQRKIFQTWMDEIYGVFKSHVTEIRGNRLKKPLDDISGGRVYMGRQALDLGLIDKLGTLDDAVKFAAQEAKLDKYERRVVPEPKSLLEKLLEGTTGSDQDEEEVGLPVNPLATHSSGTDWLAWILPYLHNLDSHKVEAVGRAFRQLQTLSREGIVLMTPEIVFNQSER
jgi:protease-4